VASRLRFGIDIDGVMYMWDKTARYMLRTERGVSREVLGQPSRYWNEIKDKVSGEDWKWLWSEGVRLGLFRYGHLFTGSIEAVRELDKIGDVIVLTHRPRSAVQDTFDWLSYMRLPIIEAYVFTNMEPKSQVKCDMYVDDKPENCIDFNDNTDGLPLLMRQESNIGWDCMSGEYHAFGDDERDERGLPEQVQPPLKFARPPRIKSVGTWGEVITYAKRLHRQG